MPRSAVAPPASAAPVGSHAPGRFDRTIVWLGLVAGLALLPVVRGLSTHRLFYVRDLGSFFWGRYLWLRREWLAGHWPLWDPHVGAGQAAYSDALNQMFSPPSVALRLVGNEVLGFNLWVLTPLPIAACGAWLLLSRRSSRLAAAVGAAAFALSGPIMSTADFPNMSWSVAMLPWMIWAVDRLLARRSGSAIATLAVCCALQCLSGEPVTFFITCVLALAYAATFSPAAGRSTLAARVGGTVVGLAFGVGLAAVQVVPMILASVHAERGDVIRPDSWSLRPTALVETIWHQLFGNYYTAASLTDVPWMPLMNDGREPLLFSLYLGIPLLTCAVIGLAGCGPRRWRLFWLTAGFCSLVLSFGSYTPLYPLLRDYVPPFGTFRFPVKYIVVAMLALAAAVALGIDHLLARSRSSEPDDARRYRRSVVLGVLLPATCAMSGAALWVLCLLSPAALLPLFQGFAERLGARDGHDAAAAMLKAIAAGAPAVVLLGAIAVVLIAVAARGGVRARRLAALALALTVVVDLQVHAWAINPVMDAAYLERPEWIGHTAVDPNARFYVGGKIGGSLDSMDFDSSRGFLEAPGLTPAESRAALSAQAVFYPSAWGARELLSYDLPVVWPREYARMVKRFERATREERDAFLDRAGVRFRILPQRRSSEHQPLLPIPQFLESFLYDWGSAVAPRAEIVPSAIVQSDMTSQLASLFTPAWHRGEAVVVDRDLAAAGVEGAPGAATARIVDESSSRLEIAATAAATGGYLVLRDSYSDEWRTLVDGKEAPAARAYAIFRAVHLTPGRHTVVFEYVPRALWAGAGISVVAALLLLALVLRPTVLGLM